MSSKIPAFPSRLERIFSIIYQNGKFTQIGFELCSEAGIDPKTLLPKELKDFEVVGQREELTKMALSHYEERRYLKLTMLDDLHERIKQAKKRKTSHAMRMNKLTFLNVPHKNCSPSDVLK
jgi:hypothetical protein